MDVLLIGGPCDGKRLTASPEALEDDSLIVQVQGPMQVLRDAARQLGRKVLSDVPDEHAVYTFWDDGPDDTTLLAYSEQATEEWRRAEQTGEAQLV